MLPYLAWGKWKLFQMTAKYMDTGTYLRPHDMQFCIERTKFSEEQIVNWFKRLLGLINNNPYSFIGIFQIQERM